MSQQEIPNSKSENSYKIYRIIIIVFLLFICYLVSFEFLAVISGLFLFFFLNEFRKKMSAVKTVEPNEIQNKRILTMDIFEIPSQIKSRLSLETRDLFDTGFSFITLQKVIFLIINVFIILTTFLFFFGICLAIQIFLYFKLPLPILLLFAMVSPFSSVLVAWLLVRELSKKNFFNNEYILLKFIFSVVIWVISCIFLFKYF